MSEDDGRSLGNFLYAMDKEIGLRPLGWIVSSLKRAETPSWPGDNDRETVTFFGFMGASKVLHLYNVT